MKLSALLNRAKGRDFYDAIFLLGQTEPDYGYLAAKWGIHDKAELREALLRIASETDLPTKSKDFEHLLFNRAGVRKVLMFREFVEGM